MTSELSPEAPVYIPPPLRNAATPKSSPSSTKSTPRSSPNTSGSIPSPLVKEPQCSRYSRSQVNGLATILYQTSLSICLVFRIKIFSN
ncbi:unnamed protein product [Acanthoscelides obtectus]|uniref:Uncharacterized protein n=1 Tax=Acanthoscelides obtectus TaxID=200917 RepID=A0A9P0LA79_ACAOB|nr:unnamed protein product [Acanthoscelides obtectus]CAK1630823.1 hypothetical protein AOBTE_LOCUS6575 [Acanthoscelides obtectus]